MFRQDDFEDNFCFIHLLFIIHFFLYFCIFRGWKVFMKWKQKPTKKQWENILVRKYKRVKKILFLAVFRVVSCAITQAKINIPSPSNSCERWKKRQNMFVHIPLLLQLKIEIYIYFFFVLLFVHYFIRINKLKLRFVVVRCWELFSSLM